VAFLTTIFSFSTRFVNRTDILVYHLHWFLMTRLVGM